jgi:GMP synthase (glutamine-hydrolysing)
MGAYDEARHPWLAAAKALLREAVADQIPTLGVCLGHQLASVALGGAVARHPTGRQVGLLPVHWTPAAADDPLFGGVPDEARAVQWNNDIVVEPPAAAELVAGTECGGPQVLRLGPRAWGVQFHPEVRLLEITRWAQSYEREASAWDVDVQEVLATLAAAEGELRCTWRPVADRFAALVGSADVTAPRQVPEGSAR